MVHVSKKSTKQTGKINCQYCGKELKEEEKSFGVDYGTCDKCNEGYLARIKKQGSQSRIKYWEK